MCLSFYHYNDLGFELLSHFKSTWLEGEDVSVIANMRWDMMKMREPSFRTHVRVCVAEAQFRCILMVQWQYRP